MDIINALKKVRETGQEIVSEDYVITFNPFTETFIMDIPMDRKYLWFNVKDEKEPYFWDCSGMYPILVPLEDSYEGVWAKLEPYTKGINMSWIDYFDENGVEYLYVEDDNGAKLVNKEDIIPIEINE